MNKKFTNRLIHQSSPYLLQHAHNPVDWYPWGEEALDKARSENKVILVSIGYSACHWCHVMERESFENEAVAELMNHHFVNIKIDREERPDLDHIYMDAVQAISGSGGWPLNVFLTPDTRPFFGGTYFPPSKAFNRPSWTDVLNGIAGSWKDKSAEILEQATILTDHLKKANDVVPAGIMKYSGEQLVSLDQVDRMVSALMKNADTQWGGFGKAPKFPQTFSIQFLLQYHYFTGNEEAKAQALLSIDRMLTGGIYDHLAGGLARYSTDTEWLAPHFEKMLYDNALLVNILCDAYQLTGYEKYAAAIRKTISFVTSELMSTEGGFFAALDADSEGEEGKYYVWTKDEITTLLGNEAALFCKFYDVSETGNWEGVNILRVLVPEDDFAVQNGMEPGVFKTLLNSWHNLLLAAREQRVKPALDDKILLGWNALMLQSLAKAAYVLQDKEYEAIAVKNALFLQHSFKGDAASAGLLHTYKNGESRYPAFLDDYAGFIAAHLQLYKATFNKTYLDIAYKYCNYVVENFSDEDAIYFYFTHQSQTDIIVRKKEIYDGATPSGNAVMVDNLYQLSIIIDQPAWKARADEMLYHLLPLIEKYPGSFGLWAAQALKQLAGINEIAIVGTDFAPIANNILLNYNPNITLMASPEGDEAYPMLSNKSGKKSTLIYLCRNYSCLAPFSDVESLTNHLKASSKITV